VSARLRVRLAVTLVAAMTAACSHGIPGEVGRRESQWRAHHLTEYDFVYWEGGMAGTCRLTISVRDGRVARAHTTRRCAERLKPRTGFTIDGVFAATRHAYRHADHVRATNVPTYGYPKSVSVDENAHAIDDEWGFGVTRFRAGAQKPRSASRPIVRPGCCPTRLTASSTPGMNDERS
jgi:uncharacterized protein DUF6174